MCAPMKRYDVVNQRKAVEPPWEEPGPEWFEGFDLTEEERSLCWYSDYDDWHDEEMAHRRAEWELFDKWRDVIDPARHESADIEALMFAGDVDGLYRSAPCRCCCHEHYYQDCPALSWNGCRGDRSEEQDEASWGRVLAAMGRTL